MSTTTGINRGNGSESSALAAIFANSASAAMRAVERAAMEVAVTELPIFITGESGAGKGTLAMMIHRLSKRSGDDFVKVNCQSLQSPLALSHGRWALGLTDRQLRGTVLLDEVLELEPALQPHVMDMLPEGDLEADAANTPRVLAATRSEDTGLNSNTRFSRELYYRLRGVVLRIPPLRERREDIPLLAHFLLNKHAATFGRSTVRFSRRAERQFQAHSWPGNVRELENAVKALLAVDDEDLVLDAIGLDTIPASDNRTNKEGSGLENGVSLKEASRIASRGAEKQLIREVLERTRWNRKRAARELNISYKALLYKLKQNGLSGPTAAEEQLGRGTPK